MPPALIAALLKQFGLDPEKVMSDLANFQQIMASIERELIAGAARQNRIEAKLDALLAHHGVTYEAPAIEGNSVPAVRQ